MPDFFLAYSTPLHNSIPRFGFPCSRGTTHGHLLSSCNLLEILSSFFVPFGSGSRPSRRRKRGRFDPTSPLFSSSSRTVGRSTSGMTPLPLPPSQVNVGPPPLPSLRNGLSAVATTRQRRKEGRRKTAARRAFGGNVELRFTGWLVFAPVWRHKKPWLLNIFK